MAYDDAFALRAQGWVVTRRPAEVAAEALGHALERVACGGGAHWRRVTAPPAAEAVARPTALLGWGGPCTVTLVPGSVGIDVPPPPDAEVTVTLTPATGETVLMDARLWFRCTDGGLAPILFRQAMGR